MTLLEDVEGLEKVKAKVYLRVVAREESECAEASLDVGVAFPELVQKSASSIGVRTACSNTDAGPAVPAVAALPRYTDGSRWYTCAAAAPHSARSRWLKTKTKVSRSHYSGLSAYGMIDIPVRRLSAYEAYRPRPLPQILRIRVEGPWATAPTATPDTVLGTVLAL